MDAKTKCLNCGKPVSEAVGRGRKKRFCQDACRKAYSRINGHEITSDGQSYRTGQNKDFGDLQVIDFVDADCPEIQEQTPSRDWLYFEEWPARAKKSDKCITYKLTDGKQINTGYGRASRALGYLMEIADGKWVARVGNLSRGPLPLGAAKKAAIELHLSRDRGEPRDWVHQLNVTSLAVFDAPPVVTLRQTDEGFYHLKLTWGEFKTEVPQSEYPEDDFAYQLHEWGYRNTFALRWP
jgi:hypothetical protein